jgi:cell fate regulator YaaT (PSP1 superfamily)
LSYNDGLGFNAGDSNIYLWIEMAQNETVKQKTPKYEKKRMLVSYGIIGYLGWFEHNLREVAKIRSKVVIKTRRGLELGNVVGPLCYRSGHFKSDSKAVEKYFGNQEKDYPMSGGGSFVRYATDDDLRDAEHLAASAAEELKCASRFADEMKLAMKMVRSEHLLGGERIVIYFLSEGRVDFRELVKRLAGEYQTRIELRQIGSRDEARLISDYETCGQECCCRRFLKILAPVNMRMAKVQKATLDPSKISGHCGRLKCCLRYEDENYQCLKKKLPKKNAIVKTAGGIIGKVVNTQILTQLVVVQDDNGNREAVPVDEITIASPDDLRLNEERKNKLAQKSVRPRKNQPKKGNQAQKNGQARKRQPKRKDNAQNGAGDNNGGSDKNGAGDKNGGSDKSGGSDKNGGESNGSDDNNKSTQ